MRERMPEDPTLTFIVCGVWYSLRANDPSPKPDALSVVSVETPQAIHLVQNVI